MMVALMMKLTPPTFAWASVAFMVVLLLLLRGTAQLSRNSWTRIIQPQKTTLKGEINNNVIEDHAPYVCPHPLWLRFDQQMKDFWRYADNDQLLDHEDQEASQMQKKRKLKGSKNKRKKEKKKAKGRKSNRKKKTLSSTRGSRWFSVATLRQLWNTVFWIKSQNDQPIPESDDFLTWDLDHELEDIRRKIVIDSQKIGPKIIKSVKVFLNELFCIYDRAKLDQSWEGLRFGPFELFESPFIDGAGFVCHATTHNEQLSYKHDFQSEFKVHIPVILPGKTWVGNLTNCQMNKIYYNDCDTSYIDVCDSVSRNDLDVRKIVHYLERSMKMQLQKPKLNIPSECTVFSIETSLNYCSVKLVCNIEGKMYMFILHIIPTITTNDNSTFEAVNILSKQELAGSQNHIPWRKTFLKEWQKYHKMLYHLYEHNNCLDVIKIAHCFTTIDAEMNRIIAFEHISNTFCLHVDELCSRREPLTHKVLRYLSLLTSHAQDHDLPHCFGAGINMHADTFYGALDQLHDRLADIIQSERDFENFLSTIAFQINSRKLEYKDEL